MSLIHIGMDTDKFEKDFFVFHCTRLQKRIAELAGLAQMIIDAESADTSLIPIMFYTWLHKAKALKEQGDD